MPSSVPLSLSLNGVDFEPAATLPRQASVTSILPTTGGGGTRERVWRKAGRRKRRAGAPAPPPLRLGWRLPRSPHRDRRVTWRAWLHKCRAALVRWSCASAWTAVLSSQPVRPLDAPRCAACGVGAPRLGAHRRRHRRHRSRRGHGSGHRFATVPATSGGGDARRRSTASSSTATTAVAIVTLPA